MPHPVADVFAHAAERVAGDACRTGNVIAWERDEQVLYTGDIHGNRDNLSKILKFANLSQNPRRRLVLQELIHGEPADPTGGDRSFELLMRVARLKNSHPGQIFFLMGNHDVAQVTGNEIMKDGRCLCKSFEIGLEQAFGPAVAEVRDSLYAFLRALPLAARCANGMLMSHSLPSPHALPGFDWSILDRPYADADLRRGGAVYEWTWGRGHKPEHFTQVTERLGARQLLLAHQHSRGGFDLVQENALVITSDDSHGTILLFDAGQEYPDAQLAELVKPIVAL